MHSSGTTEEAWGLLIAMPVEFLPEAMVAAGNLGGEETIFGPSFTCRVPAIVLDNGAIATTGTDVDVRVVDCLVDVVHSIRNFEAGEEIAYGFDADHPYALPSVDMLMALVVQWAEGLTAQRMAFYTPMMPTSSPDATPMELLSRGVSGVQYLERFGGYGRNRELGQLQYQAMTMFDFLMADNIPAAKDTLALMVVAIEQMNLDGGRSDLATLLCLQEDPPSSIFVNRHLSTTSRARAFAPLADQRWITCALAYLKELEVISAKRLELGSAKTFPHSNPPDPSPKPKAKANPKRRGKFPQKPPQEEEE